MRSLFCLKSCRARVEGIISLWTAPTPVGSFWALLSMGGAKAGKLAELQDALVLGPLGFIAETLLPGGLWNSTWDSCLITASIMHQFLHFVLSSSHWSPAMTIHANTVLHYLLSEISRRAWFSTPHKHRRPPNTGWCIQPMAWLSLRILLHTFENSQYGFENWKGLLLRTQRTECRELTGLGFFERSFSGIIGQAVLQIFRKTTSHAFLPSQLFINAFQIGVALAWSDD